nr:methyltransferase domain-containing protein [Candidatus Gracilibacteria bacterium]
MNIYLNIFILIVLLSLFSFLSLAPFVPTKNSDLIRLLKIINLKKGEKFLEIGCGTGKVSLFFAKNFPQNEIVGIELSPLFYIISKIKVFFSGLKNIKIVYGNAMKLDFSKFDIFYVFGLPETVTNKLSPKLEREMKDTSRFYSYCFKMSNDKFDEVRHKESSVLNSIYEYKIK